MTRANGEILITLEALHKALGLDDSVTITGQSTGPGDVQKGMIRLMIYNENSKPVPEGFVAPVEKTIYADGIDTKYRDNLRALARIIAEKLYD